MSNIPISKKIKQIYFNYKLEANSYKHTSSDWTKSSFQ